MRNARVWAGLLGIEHALEVLIRGVFDQRRLLDLLRSFIVYSDEPAGLVKRVAKYHQYWAVVGGRASLRPSRRDVALTTVTGSGSAQRHPLEIDGHSHISHLICLVTQGGWP